MRPMISLRPGCVLVRETVRYVVQRRSTRGIVVLRNMKDESLVSIPVAELRAEYERGATTIHPAGEDVFQAESVATSNDLARRTGGDHLLRQVEVDHMRADITVVCPRTREPIGQPTITLAVESWSRMITGVEVALDASRGRSTMACLRNSMLPKQALLAEDPREFRAEGEWPAEGVPETIAFDAAPEFDSPALRRMAMEFGIRLDRHPFGGIRWKSGFERVFRRLNKELLQTLPGAMHPNASASAEPRPGAPALLTLDELRAAIHRWVVDVYQKTPQRDVGGTPLERWTRGAAASGGVPLPPHEEEVTIDHDDVARWHRGDAAARRSRLRLTDARRTGRSPGTAKACDTEDSGSAA